MKLQLALWTSRVFKFHLTLKNKKINWLKFCSGPNKVAIITRWSYQRGGCKAGIHFILICLCVKTGFCSQSFIWKWVQPTGSFSCESNSFIWRALRKTHFETEAQGNSEMAYLFVIPTTNFNLKERILIIKNTVTSPERMNLVQELRVELIAWCLNLW